MVLHARLLYEEKRCQETFLEKVSGNFLGLLRSAAVVGVVGVDPSQPATDLDFFGFISSVITKVIPSAIRGQAVSGYGGVPTVIAVAIGVPP